MKYIFVFLILFYQKIIAFSLKSLFGSQNVCRFSPTCSVYAKAMILEYGIIKGGYLSLLRLLSCQPFIQITRSNTSLSEIS